MEPPETKPSPSCAPGLILEVAVLSDFDRTVYKLERPPRRCTEQPLIISEIRSAVGLGRVKTKVLVALMEYF